RSTSAGPKGAGNYAVGAVMQQLSGNIAKTSHRQSTARSKNLVGEKDPDAARPGPPVSAAIKAQVAKMFRLGWRDSQEFLANLEAHQRQFESAAMRRPRPARDPRRR